MISTCDSTTAVNDEYLVLKFGSEFARRSQAASTVLTGRGAGTRVTRAHNAVQENQWHIAYTIVGLHGRGMATICDTDLANPVPERIKCDPWKHFHFGASTSVASVVHPLLDDRLDCHQVHACGCSSTICRCAGWMRLSLLA